MPIDQPLMESTARIISAVRRRITPLFWRTLMPAPTANGHPAKSTKAALPVSATERRTVVERRADIHAELGRAARLGYVPDAHIHRLHANHVEELDGDRWELGQLEAKLLASLRRLEAMFPEPPAPKPEPAPPARARHYRRPSSMFDPMRAEARP
jgi:hypothetical protein